jgi:hypothetical protein
MLLLDADLATISEVDDTRLTSVEDVLSQGMCADVKQFWLYLARRAGVMAKDDQQTFFVSWSLTRKSIALRFSRSGVVVSIAHLTE